MSCVLVDYNLYILKNNKAPLLVPQSNEHRRIWIICKGAVLPQYKEKIEKGLKIYVKQAAEILQFAFFE